MDISDFKERSKSYTSLKGFVMSDGSELSFPVIVIRGAKKGPTLYVGAGIHGDELASISVVGAVADKIDPNKMSGTFIGVPVENPLAYRARNRFPPSDPRADMYDSFPGRANGGASQVMAYTLYNNLISKADALIDLHTAGETDDTVPNSYFAPTNLGSAALKSEELAEIFGAEHYNEEYDGHNGYLHVYLATKGVPAIVVELSRVMSKEIESGVRGVMNIMISMNMIEGELGPKSRILVKGPPNRPTPRVSNGGFIIYHKKIGEKLKTGDLIAEVVDVHGRHIERIESPIDGILQTAVTSPIIEPGQRVGRIAIEED